jgi:hypothetical protein
VNQGQLAKQKASRRSNPLKEFRMPPDQEVEKKTAEYLKSDLSGVRKRYEDLFGNPKPTDLFALLGLSPAVEEIDNQLEELSFYIGAESATRIMHKYYPEVIFPIDKEMDYNQLRIILLILGIRYEYGEDQTPVNVAMLMNEAIRRYRESKGLENWQIWALVYDLGPRLLPPAPPYPTDPPPCVWLSAASPGDFGSVDKHLSNDQNGWSINRNARRGDLVLM